MVFETHISVVSKINGFLNSKSLKKNPASIGSNISPISILSFSYVDEEQDEEDADDTGDYGGPGQALPVYRVTLEGKHITHTI